MSISDAGRTCLFSGISGVITINGIPVSNAHIKRVAGKAHTHGKEIDETTTDERGYFEMPPVFERSIIGKFLPMEFSVPQQIHVYYQGNEYEIWNGVKRKREENAEARGKPLSVSCELNRENKVVWVNGGAIVSQCDWDVEPDVFDTGF